VNSKNLTFNEAEDKFDSFLGLTSSTHKYQLIYAAGKRKETNRSKRWDYRMFYKIIEKTPITQREYTLLIAQAFV
jgi:hypothetical protein